MKKFLASLAFVLGALAGAPSFAAIMVTFTPSASHIEVGEETKVAMTISGLGDEILSAFDVNMLFESSILGNFSVGYFPSFFDGGAGAQDIFVTFGSGDTDVQLISYLLDEPLAATQPDAFIVLDFYFRGLADGVSSVGLGSDLNFERNFVGLNFASLPVEIGSACIAVGSGSCTVPEPSTMSLLGLAIVGGSFARWRRRPR